MQNLYNKLQKNHYDLLQCGTLCYEFHCPTKATKSGLKASEIGLRAIFHFGNGSVTFDHTLLAIRHNIVVAVLAPGVRTTRLASDTLLPRVGDLLF